MGQKRYHIVIASFIFASLTWISVNLTYDYVVMKNIPVVLSNMSQGRALKYPVPRTITVWIKSTGWLLARLYLTPGIQYNIDASSLTNDDYVIAGKDLHEHIKPPFTLQLVSVKPETLLLALDVYEEKKVPIQTHIASTFREGYGQVGYPQVFPESVLIGGSKHILQNVREWSTVYQKFSELRAPIDAEIKMEEPTYLSLEIDPPTIKYKLDVQPFAEKVFSGIALTAVGTPSNREIIFIPPKMEITVRGGIDRLARLTNTDFQAMVNYELLIQPSVEEVQPVLIAPDEVKIVNRKPERFQFIIRKRL